MLRLRIAAAPVAAMIAVLALSVWGFRASPADAAAPEFRLEAVEPSVPVGDETPLAVRLVDTASGAPVANAVLFRARLDMAPEGMGDMTAALVPAASVDPQVYRFIATPTMAGRWLLTVQAKVPGVPETVRAETIITAVEPAVGAPSPHKH